MPDETKDISRAPANKAASPDDTKQGATTRDLIGDTPPPPGMSFPGDTTSNQNDDAGSEEAKMSMTKDELLGLAESRGVAIETDDNKEDLVRKINANK